MKKAFTLAEIMIVFAVIGILTAILLPSAFHSLPDENIVKFKKANALLYKVVNEMVNSPDYHTDGDLGLDINGNLTNKSTFCENFADIVNPKIKVCDYDTGYQEKPYFAVCSHSEEKPECFDLRDATNPKNVYVDITCRKAVQNIETNIGITTNDGIVYYEPAQDNFFGCLVKADDPDKNCNYDPWGGEIAKNQRFYNGPKDLLVFEKSKIKTNRFYKIFCIDIDGLNEGEAPFAYGIRVDGRIDMGPRARKWSKKSIQQKD